MKPPLRTKSVGTKVSEAEFALLEERARGAGLRLAEWVQKVLLAAPVEGGSHAGPHRGPDPGEVALAEILARGRWSSVSIWKLFTSVFRDNPECNPICGPEESSAFES